MPKAELGLQCYEMNPKNQQTILSRKNKTSSQRRGLKS
jgi:hypothetical protein